MKPLWERALENREALLRWAAGERRAEEKAIRALDHAMQVADRAAVRAADRAVRAADRAAKRAAKQAAKQAARRPIGRPRLAGARRKTMNIRLTADQKALVEEAAETTRQHPSEWVRMVLLRAALALVRSETR